MLVILYVVYNKEGRPPRYGLSAAHKIVQIITRAVYGKIRTAFSFRITRASIFDALPSLCRMLVSAGAVAPQYPFSSIVYNDAITAIIVCLKKSAAEP